jgi:tetratricopeptide (TPR) repeat protein
MNVGGEAERKALRGGKRIVYAAALLCLLTAMSAITSPAHQFGQKPPPQRDPGGGLPTSKANKAVEVGQYYFKKGKYDAAIDRYKEAIEIRPEFGLPYRLVGEAYEKKKFKPEAIEWYEKYIKVVPRAVDVDNVRKRIEALRHEIEQDKEKRKEKARSS